MGPLTEQVLARTAGSVHEALLTAVQDELPDSAHIEHLLSHMCDYAALAARSRDGKTRIAGSEFSLTELQAAHEELLRLIAETVRWGFDADTNKAGTTGNAITDVSAHREFVGALFGTAQAGLKERRGAVELFTTNYDTLIEDALALGTILYWDGFNGGAVAFHDHRFGDRIDMGRYRATVVKLHGSIDWH